MKSKKNGVYAVILAGGQSSRLFPFNKVISDLTGSGKSLIRQAYDRAGVVGPSNVYVLTAHEMVTPIRKQLPLPSSHFFVDPARRGTWPAILWAMAHLRRENPEAVMAVLTGDHVIQKDAAFRQAFRRAVQLAQSQAAMVMLGISPSENPDEWRGFGCLRADEKGRVVEFQEKPNADQARRSLGQGGWKWNSGMFFFRIATAEAALARLQPEMNRVYQAVAERLAAGKKKDAAFLYEDFPDKIPHPLDPGHYVDNSIDYAIMTPLVARPEETLAAYVIADVGFRWTDLGRWDALRQVVKADRRGNVLIGKTALRGDVRNAIVVAERGRGIDVENAQELVIAFAGKTALVLALPQLLRVKEVAQAALKHADRVVMEHDVSGCDIQASGGRVIAVGVSGLHIRLQQKRLVVSSKRGIIR